MNSDTGPTDARAITAARQVLAMYRFKYDAEQPELVHLPLESESELIREIALTVQRSLIQIVPFAKDEWSTDAYTHLIGRDLAQTGIAVRRLYLVPHRDVIPQLVAAQIAADRSRGVTARSLAISRIAEPRVSLRNSWLVDDEALVFETERSGQSRSWAVTTEKASLAQFRTDWEVLWDQAVQQTSPVVAVSLDEPLALSADLIAKVSRDLCENDHIDRQSCAWYHGVWQYLRLIDVVSTPTWHDEFYRRSFESILHQLAMVRSPDVLVCGTADYSLLAYVLAAAENCQSQVHVSVLDHCPTPLLACRWYANRRNQRIRLIEEDVLDQQKITSADYDLITSDAFLTRFSEAQAKKVLERWKLWLRPGGHIVTTVRLHGAHSSILDISTKIDRFVGRVTNGIQPWRLFLDIEPRALERSARKYAEQMHSNNLGSTSQNILALFEECGFRIESSEPAIVTGELEPTQYVRIVANVS